MFKLHWILKKIIDRAHIIRHNNRPIFTASILEQSLMVLSAMWRMSYFLVEVANGSAAHAT